MAKVKVELTHPQEWSKLFSIIAQFSAAVQSAELIIGTIPYASAEAHEQANLLNKLRDEICPEVIEDASEIAGFLKKNEQGFIPDPEESMNLAWEGLKDAADFDLDYFVNNFNDVATAVSNFWNSIGEAMGPVCYAGWQLKNALNYHGAPSEWVDACIKYYEDNWRF